MHNVNAAMYAIITNLYFWKSDKESSKNRVELFILSQTGALYK